MLRFPHYTQLDAMDCGPTCLRIVAQHFGRSYSLQNLRRGRVVTARNGQNAAFNPPGL